MFPSYSTRRLLFGLCVLPAIAALHAGWNLLRGREVSLDQYLFVTVMGAVLLTFVWFSILRPRRDRSQQAPVALAPAAPPETHPTREFLIAFPFALAIVLVLGLSVGRISRPRRSRSTSSLLRLSR
jgi:hypothetical protein